MLAYNPSTHLGQENSFIFQGQPRVHSKVLYQRKKKKQRQQWKKEIKKKEVIEDYPDRKNN